MQASTDALQRENRDLARKLAHESEGHQAATERADALAESARELESAVQQALANARGLEQALAYQQSEGKRHTVALAAMKQQVRS